MCIVRAPGSPGLGVARRYLAALRVDQKRKRNLMRILGENGL
jgi:hypothetical protein